METSSDTSVHRGTADSTSVIGVRLTAWSAGQVTVWALDLTGSPHDRQGG